MLRSWHRRIDLALSARGAAWASAGAGGHCAGAPLEAFAQALRAAAKPPRNASVVLASELVRYLIVPWSNEVDGDAEGAALAAHHFRRVFGDAADDWVVRFDAEETGARLACAIDRSLLEGMHAAARAANCRLDSVRPFLVDAFNLWRGEFSRRPALFLTLEAGRWSAVRVAGAQWRALRGGRIEGDPATFVAELIERERALAGACLPVSVYAPAFPGFENASLGADARMLIGKEDPLHAARAH